MVSLHACAARSEPPLRGWRCLLSLLCHRQWAEPARAALAGCTMVPDPAPLCFAQSLPDVMLKHVSVQAHLSCSKPPGLNPLLQANCSHLTLCSHGQLLLGVTCSKAKEEGVIFQ